MGMGTVKPEKEGGRNGIEEGTPGMEYMGIPAVIFNDKYHYLLDNVKLYKIKQIC